MRKILCVSLCIAALLSGCTSLPQKTNTEAQAVRTDIYSVPTSSKRQEQKQSSSQEKVEPDDAEFTHTCLKGERYEHTYYTFSYSEEDEQSEWVAYKSTREHLNGNIPRGKFQSDGIVKTKSANFYEYRNSGYTKGHLVPAADMKFDQTAMDECFLMSNISPQTREFNEQIWNSLEKMTRRWTKKFKCVYIITGPILTDKRLKKMEYINNRDKEVKSKITIPERFYKIIYDYTYEGKEKMIGFIIPQEWDKDKSVMDYAVTVDEVEKATGIDFFTNLPKEEQKRLESTIDKSAWQQ